MTVENQLQEPFDERQLRELSKGGTRLTYVPVAEVIARLNSVLGTENWSIVDSDAFRDPHDNDWVIAKVTIEAMINGITTKKIGWGGQAIKLTKKGVPLDLGDEYKGATSDAFKKAATQLGIGLDIARKDEALAAEADAKHRAELENAPKADDETLDNIESYAKGLEDEPLAEFKSWWAENVGVKLRSGNVTVEQADVVLDHFGI